MVFMSSCMSLRELRKLLSDGLQPARRQQVLNHLGQCPECQRSLESLASDDACLESRRTTLCDESSSSSALVDLVSRLRECPPMESVVLPQLESGSVSAVSDVTELARKYDRLEQLGAGAASDVYRARDRTLNRTVAIKVMRGFGEDLQRARARFAREAQLVASLSDDRIVAIHQVGHLDSGTPFLVMEYIEGVPLSEWLAHDDGNSRRERVDIVRQIALGLQTAHAAGVVHRDIKPSNVMYNARTQQVTITDFGLARVVQRADRLTHDDVIAGTPSYMSPEQMRSPDTVDQRADVYSLAVLLYEVLVGQTPFAGTLQHVMHQTLYAQPQTPRTLDASVPLELQNICMKGMAKSPQQRYANIAEFAADLACWLDGDSVSARPLSVSRRLFTWCHRNPLIPAGLACLSLLLACGSLAWSQATTRLALAEQRVGHREQTALRERDRALDALSRLLWEVQRKGDKADGDAAQLRTALSRTLLTEGGSRLERIARSTDVARENDSRSDAAGMPGSEQVHDGPPATADGTAAAG